MDLQRYGPFHPPTGVGILKQYAGCRVHAFLGTVENLRGGDGRIATVALMRWDSLFDDLESQLEREISVEESDVDAEEERLRLGRLSLRDRLVALHSASAPGDTVSLGVILVHGERIVVRPVLVGRDWFSADVIDDSRQQRQCIIPLYSVLGISIDASRVSASLADGDIAVHPELSARLGLAFVLRDLCRRRRAIDIVTPSGTIHGTIDRVGKDHIDLAMHEPGAQRRASAVSELRLLPLSSVVMVRL
jgi:hypothetical protein